jgi:hypothetical protein
MSLLLQATVHLSSGSFRHAGIGRVPLRLWWSSESTVLGGGLPKRAIAAETRSDGRARGSSHLRSHANDNTTHPSRSLSRGRWTRDLQPRRLSGRAFRPLNNCGTSQGQGPWVWTPNGGRRAAHIRVTRGAAVPARRRCALPGPGPRAGPAVPPWPRHPAGSPAARPPPPLPPELPPPRLRACRPLADQGQPTSQC